MRFAIIAALSTACTSGGGGTSDAASDASSEASGRALVVDHIDDLGGFTLPATVVGRDGTTSALVDGGVIWTFGDTFCTKANPDGTSGRSSTAGWSTPSAPLALTEPLDDAGLPFQLVPYTAQEAALNKTPNGVGLWPGPVIATPTDTVVLFQHVLRASGSADAVGTAHVTEGSTVATRDTAFLFQSPEPLFSSAGATVDGGKVYLYDCQQIHTFDDACKVARAPLASMTTRSAYEFWNGSAWVSDVTQAAIFIDNASYAMSIERNPYIGRWLAIYTVPLSDDVAIRAADSLTGPWDPPVVIPGATSGLVVGDAGSNYLAKEHVELRSVDGKSVVIGYSHPLPSFGGGDPRLARITFK